MLRKRLCDLVLAIFLIGLCAVSLPDREGWMDGVDACFYGLCTLVITANVVRRPLAHHEDTRWWVVLITMVSMTYFLGFDLSADSDKVQVVFPIVVMLRLVGDLLLIYLGRSFAILPARRAIRTGWLYGLVRHPTYATYMLADGALLCTFFCWQNVVVVSGGVGLFVVRARLEEAVLLNDPAYRQYCQRTPYRLLPGIY